MNADDRPPSLETPTGELYGEIAVIAAHACGMPSAFIARATATNHRVISSHGAVSQADLPGDDGLCCRVAESGAYLEVADAAHDLRFQNDALVRDWGVRFYAGVPLVDASGAVLGVLAVVDRQPGALGASRRATLQRLAHVVVKLMEADRAERDAAWFGEILERSLNEIVIFDAETNRVLHANEGARRNLGYTLEELHGLTSSELAVDWDDDARRNVREPLLCGEATLTVIEATLRRRDGSTYPVEARVQLSSDAGRRSFIVTAHDITARKAAEEALFREKELAQITLESIGDAMITSGADGRVTYLNPVAERLTGWGAADAAGHPITEVFRIVHEDDRAAAESPVERVLRDGQLTGLANGVVLLSRDGREFTVEDSAAPIRDRAGQLVGVVLVFRDVSQARELAQHLTWQASHDVLTDLVNRREFERVAARLLETAGARPLHHAVLYIDLDQFKVVNDTCGHLAGDALLKQLAGILPSALRKSDTLARLGGDEFGVLLEGCDIAQATHIAEELLGLVRAFRFQWGSQVFALSASIGIAALDADLERVLAAADTACFLAKDKGRNQVQVFRLEDEEVVSRRGELGWAARLSKCIEDERLFLVCQRVQRLDGGHGEPEYLEMLLRMRDESGATVPPMAFIPAAERYNLMSRIDRWVIRRTLSCLSHLRRDGVGPLPRLALNLSGVSLSDATLLEFILGELDRTGVPAEALCFEVTETAAVANLARAARLMLRLRDMGCRFALDDFGSGLSSFTYLRNLPVDYLKIDGSFVRTLAEDGINLAMVDAIRRVGQVMGIRTIAESVESQAVLERLQDIGVDFAQGYHIHVPESFPSWRASQLRRGTVARAA